VHCDGQKKFAIVGQQDAVFDATETMRLLQYRVEHRREITRRRIDNLQHLSGGGLLLQRLARLGQEPRILHCDHRLCGEVFEQGDLLLGEGPYFLARYVDRAEESLIFAQAEEESGPDSANPNCLANLGRRGLDLIRLVIGDVNEGLALEEALRRGTRSWAERPNSPK
jgi:hypothetical protein